ncbi:MAG: GntR family transcriptional regulator [Kiritimatiellae bacterium]|nr:GntR family transcriptional regulator [Kiritimatiellia bacterium]
MRHGKAIPFKIDRNNRANLSTQLADGFRRAILTGYYRPGDRLPSFSEIAMELAVSIRAPREAMKRLVAENLVRSRPRIGCEVLSHGDRIWKGRVICAVLAALEGSFYFSMMIGALRRRMVASGYSLITVAVDAGQNGELDFSQLDALCGEKVDCIITIHPSDALAEHVASYGVPALAFVDIQAAPGLETLRRTNVCAVEPVAHAIRNVGVRRVLLANYAGGLAERKMLEQFGLEVESISVEANGPNFLEALKRRSMEALLERFAPGRPYPDLVIFTDDHVAFGGLLGLALRGVKVPEDVSVITMSNRGCAPVWTHSLAQIEVDPISDGETLADYAVARIECRPAPAVSWRVRFISGESFPSVAGGQLAEEHRRNIK